MNGYTMGDGFASCAKRLIEPQVVVEHAAFGALQGHRGQTLFLRSAGERYAIARSRQRREAPYALVDLELETSPYRHLGFPVIRQELYSSHYVALLIGIACRKL